MIRVMVRIAKQIFEVDVAVCEYSQPRKRTEIAPIEAILSRVDLTSISLRTITENLLILFATIIDVADINLFNANAEILKENPRKLEINIKLIDNIV